MKYRKQYAALPYVLVQDRIEVCLITSRDTGRWIVPKGWPQKSLKPYQLAAREAFEEAGLEGSIGRKALGHFHYSKRLDDDSQVACDVAVFPLRVALQALDWPEKEQRSGRWLSREEAAGLVDNEELGALLRCFEPTLPQMSKAR